MFYHNISKNGPLPYPTRQLRIAVQRLLRNCLLLLSCNGSKPYRNVGTALPSKTLVMSFLCFYISHWPYNGSVDIQFSSEVLVLFMPKDNRCYVNIGIQNYWMVYNAEGFFLCYQYQFHLFCIYLTLE